LLVNPQVFAGPPTGGNAGPTVLPWKEENGFPVFANTAASDVGDAAMSCLWVLQKEANTVYRQLQRKDAAGTVLPGEVLLARVALEKAVRARETATDASINGGLAGNRLDVALAAHKHNFEQSASSGPSLKFCEMNLDFYTLTHSNKPG